jgi:hypothetical protein
MEEKKEFRKDIRKLNKEVFLKKQGLNYKLVPISNIHIKQK